MTPDGPLVSVVMGTYNRSDVLAQAIRSVLWQTVSDWDLWVIGDACTDDSEEVVRGFEDGRIHWFNRTENFGEQSGPNNDGVRRSGGRHVAFLNHDDLWLPDHLERALEGLESTAADGVFTLSEVVTPTGIFMDGATLTGRWEPGMPVPASSWVMRRETVEAVGPWRPAHELHQVPSENWMFRAWRQGRDIRLVPRLTLVSFPAGARRGSYLPGRGAREQEEWAARIQREPDFRERELERVALAEAASRGAPLPVRRHAVRAVKDALIGPALALGIDPVSIYRAYRWRRRGGFMAHAHRERGLPPLRRAGERR
jgi:glycosyltransferase involved in cell wall biosynthesis